MAARVPAMLLNDVRTDADWIQDFLFTDAGEPHDFGAATFSMELVPVRPAGAEGFQLTSEAGSLVLQDGRVGIRVSAAQMADVAVGAYRWQLREHREDDAIVTLVFGEVTINAGLSGSLDGDPVITSDPVAGLGGTVVVNTPPAGALTVDRGEGGPVGKSAYQHAVAGGYEGTEQQFNAGFGAIAENEDDRVAAEQGRSTAEGLRVTAETGRADAEDDRVAAEGARATAETARGEAEDDRASAEAGRVTAETGRADAEGDRVAAEGARATAETARGEAEDDRAAAEAGRVTAETGRADAEDDRVAAEGARVTAEGQRAAAETARGEAEDDRAAAEAGRVTAETGRAAAEDDRVAAEGARATAETARGEAEDDRASAEAGRVTAETGRADAEGDRVAAEGLRSTAESGRVTAETGRVSAESSRVAAEASRAALSTAALAVGTGFGAFGRPIGTSPVTGADIAQAQYVFLEPATEARTIRTVVAWNPSASSKTIKLKRFTRTTQFNQVADGQPGSTTNTFNVVIPAGPGLQTVVLGTPFLMNEGEYLGFWAPAASISTVAATGDNGGYALNTSDTTVTLIASNNTAAVQLQISLQWEATKVTATRVDAMATDAAILRQTRNREMTGLQGVPWWVEDPTMMQIDFLTGLVWNPDQPGVLTTIEEHLNVRSAAGSAIDRFGKRRHFAANQMRATDRGLHFLPLPVTNLFLNPTAPATQTITVVNGSVYWAWCEGPTAKIVLSGADTCTLYAGQFRQFTASGTSLTVTVSGDCTFAQVEANNGDKPSAAAVGAQSQDEIWIKDGSALDAWMNAAAATVIVEVDSERTAFGCLLGDDRASRFYLDSTRIGVSLNRSNTPTTPVLTNAGVSGSGNPAGTASVVNSLHNIFRVGVAGDGAGTSISANGRTATSDAYARGRFRYIGKGLDNPATRAPSGRIRRIMIAKSKLSDTDLAARTAFDYGLTRTTEYYQSSLDPATFPRLRMKICYDKKAAMGRGPLPLLFLGHGTNGRDTDFTTETMGRFARRGFFVVACDMRTAAGWVSNYQTSGRDSQGRMTMDVIDAMRALKRRYADLVDFNNRTYSGYSGAEAYALAMKAPWAFDLIVAHFNIPEYQAHLAFGGTVQTAAQTTGGYASRNAITGVPMNRRSGHLWIGWDTGDTQVSPASQQSLVDALTTAGLTPFSYYKTQSGEPYRIVHGNPTTTSGNTGGLEYEHTWVEAALAGRYSRGLPAESGSGFYVPGYLFLGDPLDDDTPLIMLGSGSTAGTQHAANLTAYDLAARTFTLDPLNGSTAVAITWSWLAAAQTISSATTLTAT